MTDQNVSGAEPGSTPEPGAAGGNGSPDGGASPFSGLDGDSLKWIEQNGIKDVTGLVTKSRETEKLIGGSLRLPGKDAKPEDVSSFFEKALKPFMPETVEGYQFQMPEKMPEGMPYDNEMVDAFKTGMHVRDVPPQVADKVHDWFLNDVMIPQWEEEASTLQQSADASTKALHEAWGEPESESFKTNMEHVMKAVSGLGDGYKQALVEAKAIDAEDNILNAQLLMPLVQVSKAMFSEGSLETGEGNETNPFADDTKNWTKQSEIIGSDPEKAKRLIRAAGKDPATYRLE